MEGNSGKPAQKAQRKTLRRFGLHAEFKRKHAAESRKRPFPL
jgi:hypothetical protein